uniref:Uncharacterized protein n=1 Tax=Rhizophora mucronata TaxID=61149 RepID=A0A2P2P592_RHIMU
MHHYLWGLPNHPPGTPLSSCYSYFYACFFCCD